MNPHKLHLYTGDGKGKTTAAMGLALRALGHGQRVIIAQFMKDGASGELAALRQLPGVTVVDTHPMHGFTFTMTDEELAGVRADQNALAVELTAIIAAQQPLTVILDELAMALSAGLVDEAAARALLHAALTCAETVTTGYSAPDWLLQMSDYVTVLRAERHPYAAQGLAAREGVEW